MGLQRVRLWTRIFDHQYYVINGITLLICGTFIFGACGNVLAEQKQSENATVSSSKNSESPVSRKLSYNLLLITNTSKWLN